MCLISITVFRNYFCSLRYLPMIENTILHRVVCVYEVVHLKIAHVCWPGARWAGERWEQLLRSAQPRDVAPHCCPVDTGTQWPRGHAITTTLWSLNMRLIPPKIARSPIVLWMNSLPGCPVQIYLPATKTYFQPFEICLLTAAVPAHGWCSSPSFTCLAGPSHCTNTRLTHNAQKHFYFDRVWDNNNFMMLWKLISTF